MYIYTIGNSKYKEEDSSSSRLTVPDQAVAFFTERASEDTSQDLLDWSNEEHLLPFLCEEEPPIINYKEASTQQTYKRANQVSLWQDWTELELKQV